MKSRLVLTLLLVAGFMLSTTGATLAVSGSSGSGSAAESQYLSPTNEHGVKGAKESGTNGKNGTEAADESGETEPATVEQEAVTSEESGTLPFTGFVAIPLLLIGVAMIGFGAVLRFRARRDDTAAGH
ncbi:MAG: hypothetical protein QM729_02605 [Solirubrobacterales bacterium]